MPTYEYVCRACRHAFERFQPITATAVKTCPKCKRKRVERKVGIGAGVLFKGGGFYETDYRSAAYRSAEEAEKKSSEKKPADAVKPETVKSDDKKTPTEKASDKPAVTPAATATTEPSTKPEPRNASVPQEKRSARQGRGVGNLKQPAAPRAKPPSRASKPARKNKRK
ncbi:MAG: zinc ribbon domain-containing protein [Phycisphaerales bacterium]|nr:zinc ribbon domain-containing protein [Phycisphaerales bacterium]